MDEKLVNTFPEEELEQFDVNAIDMRFEDEVFYELGDAPAEVEDTEEELPTAPKTHGIEDAIDGTLEEV